ncbi:MAG: hypothetical protein HW407_2148 [Bacteroidetes bacterium]|nr:hypothetical protein [Bacteroidota bacterium]
MGRERTGGSLTIDVPFGGANSILHQHCDGHLADATWNRSDCLRNLYGRRKVNVANDARSVLCRRVLDTIDPNVDHDTSLLEHVAGNRFRLPDGSDDNVRLSGEGGDVARPGMGNRHDRVRSLLLLQEDVHNWFPDNVAAPHHNYMFAGRIIAATHEQYLDSRVADNPVR